MKWMVLTAWLTVSVSIATGTGHVDSQLSRSLRQIESDVAAMLHTPPAAWASLSAESYRFRSLEEPIVSVLKPQLKSEVLKEFLASGEAIEYDGERYPEWALTEQEKRDHMLSWQKDALQRYADDLNVVLIIRTPEVETVMRMKEMFHGQSYPSLTCKRANEIQAKGLDVHHKSSNWGPMSGFVTVDPFFSKGIDKLVGGNPNPNIIAKSGDLVDHMLHNHLETRVGIIQLRLKINSAYGLLKPLPKKMSYCESSRCPALSVDDGESRNRVQSCIQFSDVSDEKYALKSAVVFCVSAEGKVSWTPATADGVSAKKSTPLYVFAYGTSDYTKDDPIALAGEPVTGDFDLWLTAYNVRGSDFITESTTFADLFVPGPKALKSGTGMASTIEEKLVNPLEDRFNLNRAVIGNSISSCNVFLHPSEMFNEGFMQDVPGRFIFIIPTYLTTLPQIGPFPMATGVHYVPEAFRDEIHGIPAPVRRGNPVPNFTVMGDLLAALVKLEYVFNINVNYAQDAGRIAPGKSGAELAAHRDLLGITTKVIFDRLESDLHTWCQAGDDVWRNFISKLMTFFRVRLDLDESRLETGYDGSEMDVAYDKGMESDWSQVLISVRRPSD